MSTTTGTATSYTDLLNKLNTWLTVTISPAWTSKRAVAGSEMIWQAPGAGSDAILVGAKEFHDAGADFWNWRLGGFLAYDGALPFENQAGYVGESASPSPVLTLWNGSITYWFVANARRVIVVAKVSTRYMVAYLGFLNQYMSPGSYPYPVVVGGSMAFDVEPALNSTDWRYTSSADELANFPVTNPGGINDHSSALRLRLENGRWLGFNQNNLGGAIGRVWPYCNMGAGACDWRPNLDGGYSMLPIVLADSTPNVYGELEGIFALTGHGNGAENTITISAVDYLVVPNVFRTSKQDFFAVKLA